MSNVEEFSSEAATTAAGGASSAMIIFGVIALVLVSAGVAYYFLVYSHRNDNNKSPAGPPSPPGPPPSPSPSPSSKWPITQDALRGLVDINLKSTQPDNASCSSWCQGQSGALYFNYNAPSQSCFCATNNDVKDDTSKTLSNCTFTKQTGWSTGPEPPVPSCPMSLTHLSPCHTPATSLPGWPVQNVDEVQIKGSPASFVECAYACEQTASDAQAAVYATTSGVSTGDCKCYRRWQADSCYTTPFTPDQQAGLNFDVMTRPKQFSFCYGPPVPVSAAVGVCPKPPGDCSCSPQPVGQMVFQCQLETDSCNRADGWVPSCHRAIGRCSDPSCTCVKQ